MASSPMRRLFSVGRLHVYWAARDRFTQPGLTVWTGKRHVRILPVPRSGPRYS